MASYLSLCTDFATLSGLIATPPAAVTGQSGQALKVVTWVKKAWEAIQNSSADWTFLAGEVSATALTINTMSYTSTALGVSSRFGEWRGDRLDNTGRLYRAWSIYDNAIGVSDEVPLHEVTYNYWREVYDRGSHDASRPIVYALAPDKTIRFGGKPDSAYRVRGEYVKAPQVLAADADVPDMPSRFHDIIVWRAILLASEQGEAPSGIAYAQAEFYRLLSDMQRDLLPAITARGSPPLA